MRTGTILRWAGASVVVASAALFTGQASAAVPGLITQQGRLYDASDVPINATLDVQFAIYSDPNAAVPIWTEVHQITFDQGYFSIALGSITPFDKTTFDGSVRYLGITVGSDPEMAPRAQVGSVPYAIVAGDVNGDIHPTSVSIGMNPVIDANGKWVGSAVGLQGPQGPQGPQGLQGPQGQVGGQGPAGPAGPVGPAGAIGPTGSTGATGAAGSVGAQGVAGPAGPQGPAGAVGPAGPAGATGAVGPAGPAGGVGPTGPQGPQGVAGPAGAAGAAGPQGPQGPVGPQGSQGPQGVAGVQGVQGPAGAAGAAGAVGATGAVGPTGPTGAVGSTGAAGATGIVTTGTFAGFAGSIVGNSPAFVFAGPTAVVTTTTATQKMVGSAESPFGISVAPNIPIDFGLCYQPNAGGALVLFAGALNYSAAIVTTIRTPFAAAGMVVPGLGTWKVGFCVRNGNAATLDNNDWVNGYVQVTN